MWYSMDLVSFSLMQMCYGSEIHLEGSQVRQISKSLVIYATMVLAMSKIYQIKVLHLFVPIEEQSTCTIYGTTPPSAILGNMIKIFSTR